MLSVRIGGRPEAMSSRGITRGRTDAGAVQARSDRGARHRVDPASACFSGVLLSSWQKSADSWRRPGDSTNCCSYKQPVMFATRHQGGAGSESREEERPPRRQCVGRSKVEPQTFGSRAPQGPASLVSGSLNRRRPPRGHRHRAAHIDRRSTRCSPEAIGRGEAIRSRAADSSTPAGSAATWLRRSGSPHRLERCVAPDEAGDDNDASSPRNLPVWPPGAGAGRRPGPSSCHPRRVGRPVHSDDR